MQLLNSVEDEATSEARGGAGSGRMVTRGGALVGWLVGWLVGAPLSMKFGTTGADPPVWSEPRSPLCGTAGDPLSSLVGASLSAMFGTSGAPLSSLVGASFSMACVTTGDSFSWSLALRDE